MHHHPDDGGDTFFQNTFIYSLFYDALLVTETI
jgi:hypothetical protein